MAPNIFEYTNYRDFLRDSYAHLKKTQDNFSYRYFAIKAGFSSSGFLHLIIDGKRNLSKDSVPRFSSALGLSKKEQQFFDTIVSFNQAKTPEAKRYYLELIHNLRSLKVGTSLGDHQFNYLSNWFYPVIRELISLLDFEENTAWIKARLCGRITCRQAQEAIDSLLKMGLVKRDASGRLVLSDANLTTEEEVKSTAAYTFHQQMLSVAKDVLATIPAVRREVSGITMAVSRRHFNEIKKKIHQFRNEVMQYLVDNPEMTEEVVQLDMLLFPLTNGETRQGGAK